MKELSLICFQCRTPTHNGTCTCCWYPKTCPSCFRCDKCGYWPLSIDEVFDMGNTFLQWADDIQTETLR